MKNGVKNIQAAAYNGERGVRYLDLFRYILRIKFLKPYLSYKIFSRKIIKVIFRFIRITWQKTCRDCKLFEGYSLTGSSILILVLIQGNLLMGINKIVKRLHPLFLYVLICSLHENQMVWNCNKITNMFLLNKTTYLWFYNCTKFL